MSDRFGSEMARECAPDGKWFRFVRERGGGLVHRLFKYGLEVVDEGNNGVNGRHDILEGM